MTSANAGFFMYLLWCNEDRADNDDILWLIKNERNYEASECSVNCTNDIVKLLDERIALQLEELDFEIREEGNKTNLYKMHDEYKIDLEMLSKDVN